MLGEFSLGDIFEIVKEADFTLLNEKYKNANTLLHLKCNKCGEITTKTYRNLKKNPHCKYCYIKAHYTDETRRLTAIEKAHRLSLQILNKSDVDFKSRDVLKLKCDRGHIFSKTVKEFIKDSLYKSNGCAECSRLDKNEYRKVKKTTITSFLIGVGCSNITFLKDDNYFYVKCMLPCGHIREGDVRWGFYENRTPACRECSLSRMIRDGDSTLKYLRRFTYKFKKDILSNCEWKDNYKGVIVVHHKTAFVDIVKKLCSNNGIPFHMKIEKYDKTTMEALRKLVLDYHSENALNIGIALPESVHIEFHKQYGWYGATEKNLVDYLKDNNMYDKYF